MPKNYTETDTHVLFLRGPFSNFVTADITYRGYSFQTTEQAFMYAKAVEFNDEETAVKLLDPLLEPWAAKKLGREVKNYNEQVWSKVRYTRMLEVNREKYKNTTYANLLLATKNKTLVECNPRDNIWGIGLAEEDPRCLNKDDWKGQNLLGEVLMQIRKELQEKP